MGQFKSARVDHYKSAKVGQFDCFFQFSLFSSISEFLVLKDTIMNDNQNHNVNYLINPGFEFNNSLDGVYISFERNITYINTYEYYYISIFEGRPNSGESSNVRYIFNSEKKIKIANYSSGEGGGSLILMYNDSGALISSVSEYTDMDTGKEVKKNIPASECPVKQTWEGLILSYGLTNFIK